MRVAVVGSGRSVHVVTRAAAVAARGHEVCLVTVGPVLPSEGIEVRTRPMPATLFDAARAAWGFLKDVDSFRPDILHLHYAGGKLGTLALLAGVHPLVVTVMGGDVLPEMHPKGLPPIEGWATRRILNEADLVLAKSEALLPFIAAFGRYAGRVEVVRWGVDPARFRRDAATAECLRHHLGLSVASRVILSPRLLNPVYNVHVIVEAMPRILERVPEAMLLVTEYNPDEEYRRMVRERIRDKQLEARVRFVGSFDQAEMPAVYSLAEVVVSLASADGLPQSLLEAMACQTPVVLSGLPAYDEVVADGETALLTRIEPESVAKAVIRILTDAALRRSVADRALDRVLEAAYLPRDAGRVDAFYRELAAEGNARRPRSGRVLDGLSLLLR